MKEKQGTEERMASRRIGRSMLIAAAALALILSLFAAGGVFASLKDTTSPVTVEFVPVRAACAVNADRSVTNTGSIPVLVRAKVLVNWVDAQGSVLADVGEQPVYAVSEGWQQIGDFLYYQGVLEPGAVTSPAAQPGAGTAPDGAQLQMVVLAQAIQAEPAEASREAWGLDFAEGSWTAEG